jgi:hypothetical protein
LDTGMTLPTPPGEPTYPGPPYDAGQPAYGQPPYDQPAYDQPAYDQPAYGQPAYGQPTYGQPAYGQPAYGQPPPYGQPSAYGPPNPLNQGAGYGYPPVSGYGYPQPAPDRLSAPVTGWLLLIAGVVGVVGSISPWAKVNFFVDIRVSGMQGDGKLTLVCALIVGVMGLLIVLRQGRLWTSIVALVFAAITVLIALIDVGDINQLYGSGENLPHNLISTAYGIWLVVIAGAAGVLAAIVAMVRRTAVAPRH